MRPRMFPNILAPRSVSSWSSGTSPPSARLGVMSHAAALAWWPIIRTASTRFSRSARAPTEETGRLRRMSYARSSGFLTSLPRSLRPPSVFAISCVCIRPLGLIVYAIWPGGLDGESGEMVTVPVQPDTISQSCPKRRQAIKMNGET